MHKMLLICDQFKESLYDKRFYMRQRKHPDVRWRRQFKKMPAKIQFENYDNHKTHDNSFQKKYKKKNIYFLMHSMTVK